MAAKFGTSGLRGLATELIGFEAKRYALAFLKHINAGEQGAACVAWDFRESSPAILANVGAAFAAQGIRMICCGEVPTPALAAYAMKRGLASIMITGSHIPADRNGIKFYRADGEISKADELAIQEIAGAIKAPDLESAGVPAKENVRDVVLAEFVERYSRAFAGDSLAGMTIGVYQHSTVARDVLVTVLAALGAQVVSLGRSDHFIPVDTEAVSTETRQFLKTWADTKSFAAIVSADGDGDRPLLTDETGDVVPGDVLGLVTSKYVGAKTVVTPVTSNSGIDVPLGFGIRRTRVGSPFVIAEMEKALADRKEAVVGFEANGGFLTMSPLVLPAGLLDALPTRDSFLPLIAVLAAAKVANVSISKLVQTLKLPVTVSDRIENVATDKSLQLIEHLKTSREAAADFFAEKGKVLTVDDRDGMRFGLDEQRMIHFRPSGNAPEFRIYVEAATTEKAKHLMDWAQRAVLGFMQNLPGNAGLA